jgi:F-type H+-transporting ATPase subunit gamma
MPEQPKVIRKRIKSVSSTRKITRTMEMVAGAKLRAAQQRVQSSGPYLRQLRELLREIGGSGKRALLFVITANRGLCGGFNANLMRLGRQTRERLIAEGHEVTLHLAGRKGIAQARFQGIALAGAYVDELSDRPTPEHARYFQKVLVDPFLNGEVDEVLVVYPHWKTTTSHPPSVLKLLPIAPEEDAEEEQTARASVPPLFEPSPEAILDQLLPLYLRQTIYSVLAEAVAAEQFARRMAMKLATDNANEMVNSLTRDYNKARQALITKELAEILGGAEALK